jgi:energy-coupling factor transport system substrate-specific component
MNLHSNKPRIDIKDIAQIGLMVAVIEVCKAALAFLPNIELTSFWLIMFTLFFGWKIVAVVPVFILIEGSIYGMNLWWIMYLYIWPLLVLIVWLLRKNDSAVFWAVLSGVFGLCFGALCSIPYIVIGFSSGGFINGIRSGFVWWVAGIPWDFIHCAGNFVLMLILYRPVRSAMKKIQAATIN